MIRFICSWCCPSSISSSSYAPDVDAPAALRPPQKRNAEPVQVNLAKDQAASEALEEARQSLHTLPTAHTEWDKMGGPSIQLTLCVVPSVKESPVRLVDAEYLVKLAENGERMRRRQELPGEAFLDLAELRGMAHNVSEALRIIVISHPWLQPVRAAKPNHSTLRFSVPALSTLIASLV